MPQRQECVAHFTLDPQWPWEGVETALWGNTIKLITDIVHGAPCWLCLRVFQAPEFLKKSPQKSSPEDLIVKPGGCSWPLPIVIYGHSIHSPGHLCSITGRGIVIPISSLPGLLWEIDSLTHGLYGYPKAPGKFQGAVSRGILSVITGTWPTAHLGPPLPGMGTSFSWPRGGARNKTSKASFCCGSCASLPPSLTWA